MLYKYLFYSVSYITKKYDHLWKVEEMYFIGGGLTVGLTIGISIFNLIDIVGILFYHPLLISYIKYTKYLPLILGLSITIYLGMNGRHEKIYNEVKNMNPQRKRIYKVLNIIHIVVVYGLMFILGDIVRDILN